ncbi:hypothetical protein [Sphingobacterium bambusae]|uniref:Uncharacterized protein n=1 Tax=Sphingobacterium bambusae TaxID=662858 RepID=A0ABW6BKY0_9SPHI|nr:hypothetical protein [Sphingobacterium bambusae]WPL48061.1 hypothetical protein SCB77_19095 [Sphingobacterium bambusae]
MRKFFTYIGVFSMVSVVFSIFVCNALASGLKNDPLKVLSIKKVKDFYIMELTRNDSIFTALSFIQEIENGNEIERGNSYPLVLKKIFPMEKRAAYNGNTGAAYVFRGKKIKRNNRNHWSVYVVKNLNGKTIRN